MVHWTRSTTSWIVALVGVALVGVVPSSAHAQFGAQQRPSERLLVLAPQPARPGDTTYALELAHELRRRLDGKFRGKFRVIETETICQMLTESGYRCTSILGSLDSERLARALQSDAYILGTLSFEGQAPRARLRMVDIGRSGLSGWLSASGAANIDARRFAETLADTLDAFGKAAEQSRECTERRDRGDFRGAIDRAQRVFQTYPNHPSAAMCAAVVFEAQQAPADSIIAMYRKATQGDSLLERAWERLGRLYQEKGDSLSAISAFRELLNIHQQDRDRWRGVIAGYITVRRYDDARDLADDWLSRNEGDLEFLQLKARACVEGALWSCALNALAAQYERDSSLVGDTVFYRQIIGAAQSARDSILDALAEVDSVLQRGQATSPDSLSRLRSQLSERRNELTDIWVRWSAEAVRRDTMSVAMLRAHATALEAAGMTDSVLPLYGRLIALDPNDVRATLALARNLVEGITIDTAVPLDTARLFRAERLLDRLVAMSRDTSIIMNAAALYLQPGVGMARLAGSRSAWVPHAIRLLEKSDAANVLRLPALEQQAGFFLGLAYMMRIFAFDQRVTQSKSCQLVAEEAEMIRRGKQALTTGRNIAPQTADQFMQQYTQMEARIPELRRAFECRGR